ncbi:hypothetical protein J5837_03020 [Pseudoxanthomonas helianthi]|uniref:Uncharacterized protein n=1 Tax=Pseudoxanthomonas helianthi TaxID=1453541 RepID=A0A941AS24_9GAMM|nr:hypothetical protein [Pseudoxanthomonas helianthi]MBP3983384.1 hypothetical protein [Pseudoxanthomonas helianthi]
MDEQSLHRLRNELNIISIGVLILKDKLRLSGAERREAMEVLRKMEAAIAECAALVRKKDPPSGELPSR